MVRVFLPPPFFLGHCSGSSSRLTPPRARTTRPGLCSSPKGPRAHPSPADLSDLIGPSLTSMHQLLLGSPAFRPLRFCLSRIYLGAPRSSARATLISSRPIVGLRGILLPPRRLTAVRPGPEAHPSMSPRSIPSVPQELLLTRPWSCSRAASVGSQPSLPLAASGGAASAASSTGCLSFFSGGGVLCLSQTQRGLLRIPYWPSYPALQRAPPERSRLYFFSPPLS